jgi:CBS domain-containing protein
MANTSVKNVLDEKKGAVISVTSDAHVRTALELTRDHRVRSVLVIDGVSSPAPSRRAHCAIKVLLPGGDAGATRVDQIMTRNPMTVKPTDPLDRGLHGPDGGPQLPSPAGG